MDSDLQPDPLGRIINYAVLDPINALHDTLLHGRDDIIEDGFKFVCYYFIYLFFNTLETKGGVVWIYLQKALPILSFQDHNFYNFICAN